MKKLNSFKYIQNIADNKEEATILLYQQIGDTEDENGNISTGINGNEFALELLYLASIVKIIHVRINSIGGRVLEGFSIISSILNSNAKIITYNDGIAASISALILMCGKERYAMDYSLTMIHNPAGENVD